MTGIATPVHYFFRRDRSSDPDILDERPKMRIDPLMTAAPHTGAVRYLTDDLLADTYLAPRAPDGYPTAALEFRSAPWRDSLEAAPAETQRAIERGLAGLARATRSLDPAEIDLSRLPESRARAHLAALKSLWQDTGHLPAPLSVWAHVLGARTGDALEPLPLIDPGPCPHEDAAETALRTALAAHHGAVPEPVAAHWARRQPARGATAPGSYGALQEHLGTAAAPMGRDGRVTCHGLRDPAEEARFAAALAQRMIDDGRASDPREIGILAPDDPVTLRALRDSCDALGLPLAGAPGAAGTRDLAGEALSLALVLLSGPAPRTALASLFVSPLMPWPRETGRAMAREVMERGWSRIAAGLTGPGRDLVDALRPAQSPAQLFARLGVLVAALQPSDLAPRVASLRAVTQETIDWPLLHKLATPRPGPAEGPERFVEGVSLFGEGTVPWRPVRQLIVLGMTGPHWPRSPGSDPFFTEAEIARVREATGLALRGRRERLARGLELFRRQLCAGTEGLTLLAPARSMLGDRLSPSIGLSLIAHMLGAKAPSDLIEDVRAMPSARWPVAARARPRDPGAGVPVLPADGVLRLARGLGTPDKPGLNLLTVRSAGEGPMPPQSPSRLETLIVSPLAWLLEELDARDRTWAPESLDVMTLGTLVHQVLEDAFPEGVAPPDDATLAAAIPDHLEAALRKHARWLSGPSWATERASLRRELEVVAANWARFLSDTGAEVLHNEVALAGDHGGLLLHGKADCLLRLPDGRILVVDHKRSSAPGRRDRMAKGWDLQVALYRAMLQRPSEESPLTRLVRDGVRIVTAYHMTRDATVLADHEGAGIARVEAAAGDVSEHALSHLAQAVAEVAAGTVRLNRAGDARAFEKSRGIKAYALEGNPLVTAFTLPEEESE